jgi:hypothetical protein
MIYNLFHFHPFSRLIMTGVIPPLPLRYSWRGAYLSNEYVFTAWYMAKHRGKLHLYLLFGPLYRRSYEY